MTEKEIVQTFVEALTPANEKYFRLSSIGYIYFSNYTHSLFKDFSIDRLNFLVVGIAGPLAVVASNLKPFMPLFRQFRVNDNLEIEINEYICPKNEFTVERVKQHFDEVIKFLNNVKRTEKQYRQQQIINQMEDI